MQPNQRGSVVSGVRRRQIVDAAAGVLAREGLSRTSLGRIAAEAGLSSAGLISYHFADKDDLFVTLTEQLVESLAADLDAAVDAAATPAAAVGAYIRAFVGWQDRNRVGVRALWRLSAGWKAPGKDCAFDEGPIVDPLHRALGGQDLGGLDPTWVATAILRAVEGFHEVGQADPDVDADEFGRQIATLFERGISE